MDNTDENTAHNTRSFTQHDATRKWSGNAYPLRYDTFTPTLLGGPEGIGFVVFVWDVCVCVCMYSCFHSRYKSLSAFKIWIELNHLLLCRLIFLRSSNGLDISIVFLFLFFLCRIVIIYVELKVNLLAQLTGLGFRFFFLRSKIDSCSGGNQRAILIQTLVNCSRSTVPFLFSAISIWRGLVIRTAPKESYQIVQFHLKIKGKWKRTKFCRECFH